jgi:hypothetical protein
MKTPIVLEFRIQDAELYGSSLESQGKQEIGPHIWER